MTVVYDAVTTKDITTTMCSEKKGDVIRSHVHAWRLYGWFARGDMLLCPPFHTR